MIWKYPQEAHDLVREWSTKLRDRELAAFVNDHCGTEFTASSMKAFRANHGYRNGMSRGLSKEEYMARHYPQGMFEYIRDNSWGVSSKEMAERVKELFGVEMTPTCMKQFRQRHGIKSGVTGWYQKGHEPGTKGKTLEEICKGDPEKLARVRSTQFKKGDRPVNEMQIGDITVVNGYKLRKKSMTGKQWERWEFLHRAVWIEHNGPIPEGMVVTFRDSNPMNCNLSNLMLITKGQNVVMTRKGYRSGDPDITETGAALAALEITVNKKKRKKRRKL